LRKHPQIFLKLTRSPPLIIYISFSK
jgi:hypothetical protein